LLAWLKLSKRKQASHAPVEIQTDSSMLEICMQSVYSLLQFDIIFTCQLLPNKVVTRPDVVRPQPHINCGAEWPSASFVRRRPST